MTLRRVTLALVSVALLVAAAIAAGVALGSGGAKRDAGQPPRSASAPSFPRSNSPEKKFQYAVVDSDGTLGRHSKDVTGSFNLGTGTYEVDFKKNIFNCGELAGVGVATTGGGSVRGIATTAQRAGNENFGVFVVTMNNTGTDTNEPFHLIVMCG